MWWPGIGGYYVGSCVFNNVSFLSYFLTLTPSVDGFAELPATILVIFASPKTYSYVLIHHMSYNKCFWN